MSLARLVRKLDELLAQQAHCLMHGDMKGAFAIAPAIEKLVDRLEGAPQPEPSVTGLQRRAMRNAELIAAAKKGVAAAQAAIADAGPEETFQTYDAQGRATLIGNGR